MATNKQIEWLNDRVTNLIMKERCNIDNYEGTIFRTDLALDRIWNKLIRSSVITEFDWCMDRWDEHHEMVEFTFHGERCFVDITFDWYQRCDSNDIKGWNVGTVEGRTPYYFLWR